MGDASALDTTIRRFVYDRVVGRGTPPTREDIAQTTGRDALEIRESLLRLSAARVFVLQPHSGEILMAPPFSAVPTPFVVRTGGQSSYANCAWDALGVPVMMRQSARVDAACGCCGEALTLETRMDGPPMGVGIIHFAVPARRWWDDIVFT
jgi:hypothetical protein